MWMWNQVKTAEIEAGIERSGRRLGKEGCLYGCLIGVGEGVLETIGIERCWEKLSACRKV